MIARKQDIYSYSPSAEMATGENSLYDVDENLEASRKLVLGDSSSADSTTTSIDANGSEIQHTDTGDQFESVLYRTEQTDS